MRHCFYCGRAITRSGIHRSGMDYCDENCHYNDMMDPTKTRDSRLTIYFHDIIDYAPSETFRHGRYPSRR